MCFQGLVIVTLINSNYPLDIIGLMVSRPQVKTVDGQEKRDSRHGDSVVKRLKKTL